MSPAPLAKRWERLLRNPEIDIVIKGCAARARKLSASQTAVPWFVLVTLGPEVDALLVELRMMRDLTSFMENVRPLLVEAGELDVQTGEALEKLAKPSASVPVLVWEADRGAFLVMMVDPEPASLATEAVS